VASLKSVWAALDAVPVVEPPPDFARRIAAAVHADRAAQQERRRWRIEIPRDWARAFTPLHAVGLAGAAALLAIGLLFPLPTPAGASLWDVIGSLFKRPAPTITLPLGTDPEVSVMPAAWAGDHWQGSIVVEPKRELTDAVVTATVLMPVEGRLVETGEGVELRSPILSASQRQQVNVPLGNEPQGARGVSVRIAAKGLAEEVRRIAFFPLGQRAGTARPITLRIDGADLHMALLQLSAASGSPIIVDGALSGRISLSVQNAPLGQALDSVVTQVGGRLEPTPGGFVLQDR
jgi:hypothetical protein